MPFASHRLNRNAGHRLRTAAQELCLAVECHMDDLIALVEEETTLVRAGKLFALKDLEARKKRSALEFINGLEAVKKIRPTLEKHAPDAIYSLRRRHAEFRSMLQLSLAALATAKEVSDSMLDGLSGGREYNSGLAIAV